MVKAKEEGQRKESRVIDLKKEKEKKNFKTFLFDVEGAKYFFVILWGDK